MIERREHDGFTLKPGEALWILQEHLGEDFERDVAMQLRVAGSVHLPHAASADVLDDFVGTDLARRSTNGVIQHHRMRNRLQSRRTQELVHAPCLDEERLDLSPELIVAPARRRKNASRCGASRSSAA